MENNTDEIGDMLIGMRKAYLKGENAMEYARKNFGLNSNIPIATLISYDLQSGTYIKYAEENSHYVTNWCAQLAEIIAPHLSAEDTLLEVGCGEATTLAGVMQALEQPPAHAYGFDISWSRCAHARRWLAKNDIIATLFVSDLFSIPLADSSIDVVYTSHSLEPNGGREAEAIAELLRVARKAVVMIEPAYELASPQAQERMRIHGYVRDLKEVAMKLNCEIFEHRLLPICANQLNPSGLLTLMKNQSSTQKSTNPWQCPITRTPLISTSDGYYSLESGLVYPVLKSIPLIRAEHAVIASSFENIDH